MRYLDGKATGVFRLGLAAIMLTKWLNQFALNSQSHLITRDAGLVLMVFFRAKLER